MSHESTRPLSPVGRPKNRLLASLPDADFERLRPHLRNTGIKPRQIPHAANEPIADVVFLNGGVASVTTVMQDGAMVEVATIGDEGVVGIDVVLGAVRCSRRCNATRRAS